MRYGDGSCRHPGNEERVIRDLKTQIIIGERIGYIPPELSYKLKDECEEISKILGALIRNIN
ncbi:four helix bundle protein [Aliivibrio wodanis]|uniref:four helix bundle protein n=1 Tax=Aliivibrio wodanis TaxID=80852 RepID=UPI00406CC169